MNVRPKKALGQHFLKDLDVARRIADTVSPAVLDCPAGVNPATLPVLEIGPGTGVLTRFLLESGREVKAVELDSESVEYLHSHLPSLDVMEADFLRLDLSTLFPPPGDFILIGNYPYNISSQIFFKALDYKDNIPVIAGMLQKEVAERICSRPGGKVYGILSVLLQAWYDCEYLFTVPPSVFNPPPKVQSGVLRLTRNSRTSLGCDEARFKSVVKTAFGQRRKTLRNSLSPFLSNLPAGSPVLSDPILSQRPERLSVEEFIQLTRAVTPRSDSAPE